MAGRAEWIGLPEAVHRSGGLMSRWDVYAAAMEGRIESRRRGRLWEVSAVGFSAYLRKLRTAVELAAKS